MCVLDTIPESDRHSDGQIDEGKQYNYRALHAIHDKMVSGFHAARCHANKLNGGIQIILKHK